VAWLLDPGRAEITVGAGAKDADADADGDHKAGGWKKVRMEFRLLAEQARTAIVIAG